MLTQTFVDIDTLSLRLISLIIFKSGLAYAFVATVGVLTVCIDTSIEVLRFAFIDVIAFHTVACVAALAFALVGAVCVDAVSIIITLVLSVGTFIKIIAFANHAGAAVALVAFTHEAAGQVEAAGVLVAPLLLEGALVDV